MTPMTMPAIPGTSIDPEDSIDARRSLGMNGNCRTGSCHEISLASALCLVKYTRTQSELCKMPRRRRRRPLLKQGFQARIAGESAVQIEAPVDPGAKRVVVGQQ